MATMTTVEVWMIIDSEGSLAVGRDAGEATEEFSDDHGYGENPTRMVRVTVQLALPEALECVAVAPDEDDMVAVKAS